MPGYNPNFYTDPGENRENRRSSGPGDTSTRSPRGPANTHYTGSIGMQNRFAPNPDQQWPAQSTNPYGSSDPTMNWFNRAQDMTSGAMTSFANQLTPQLNNALETARSRFGGGAIRSGGAQEREEDAFNRMFGRPMLDYMSMMSGQNRDWSGMMQNRFMEERGVQDRFDKDLEFRRESQPSGWGSLLGSLGGSFLGPVGTALGGKLGEKLFNV